MGSMIAGIGAALPDRRMTNHDLEKLVDTSDEWIVTRTGIRERRIVDDETCTSDLVARAAERAIEDAGVTVDEIDALIVGTATPDTVFPATACWAQGKIGLGQIPVFDISAACSAIEIAWAVAETE